MNLKKKLTAIACAAALMLALPTLAWADPSPEYVQDIKPGFTTGFATGYSYGLGIRLVDFNGEMTRVYDTPAKASNVPDGAKTVVSWVLEGNVTNLDLEFNNGDPEAKRTVTIFVEYENGGFEQQVRSLDSEGDFGLYTDRLSGSAVFSIVEGDYGNSSNLVSDYQPGFKHETTGQDGDPVSTTLDGFDGTVTSVIVSQQTEYFASNVPADATVLYTWVIEGDATNVDLTFQVEKQYAGQKVTVFIEHGDGAVEQKVATVGEDGTFKIRVDRLSHFSIALGDYGDSASAPASDSLVKLDPNAKSPKTGVDLGGVAAATAIVALAAGAAFVGLRKAAAK